MDWPEILLSLFSLYSMNLWTQRKRNGFHILGKSVCCSWENCSLASWYIFHSPQHWLEFGPKHEICAWEPFFKWGWLSSLGAVIGGMTHAKFKFVWDMSIIRNRFRELILILMMHRISTCTLSILTVIVEVSTFTHLLCSHTRLMCIYACVCVASLMCVSGTDVCMCNSHIKQSSRHMTVAFLWMLVRH